MMYNGSNSNSEGEGPSGQFYAGGLVDGNPKPFPSSSSNGEDNMETPGGELGIKTANGGPAVNGGYTTEDFLDDRGYSAGNLDVRPGDGGTPPLKVRNPDDLSSSPKS